MTDSVMNRSASKSEKNDTMPPVSRGRRPGEILLVATVSFLIIFVAVAFFSHRHWWQSGKLEKEELGPVPVQLVSGYLLADKADTYLPDASQTVALAIPLPDFDASLHPLLEVELPNASEHWQYRLAWYSSDRKSPHFFVINQPVNGISLTDLSLVDGWQGRIIRLGLVVEPLFPLGWSGTPEEGITIKDIRFPAPDLWQAIRHQWHAWLAWQPPRYGDINHLPYSTQIPSYATPTAVVFLTLVVLIMWRWFRHQWHFPDFFSAVAGGSLALIILSMPQWYHTSQWATESPKSRTIAGEPMLTSDQSLGIVIQTLLSQEKGQPPGNEKIYILDNDYEALRLYWYLLPRNSMWFPGWTTEMAEHLAPGQVYLTPSRKKSEFNELLHQAQKKGLGANVTRASADWWLVTIKTAKETAQ